MAEPQDIVRPLVTVFGATGFLGRQICRALVEDGWWVRLAARHPEQVLIAGVPADRSERMAVDIRDRGGVAEALEGAAAAVNAVSLYAESRRLRFEDVHVRGAANLAECARAGAVDRLVHISGIGADTASPSKYIRARARGEEAVREAFSQATILRPSVLFGPGDDFLASLKRVSAMPLVPLFGRGETRLQPVHVEDVAEAVSVALARPDSTGELYELGGGQVLKYREALAMVLSATGRRRRLVRFPFAGWHLLATMLGWLPSPPLTRDQVYLMAADNVCGVDRPGFDALGIEPRGFEQSLGQCL